MSLRQICPEVPLKCMALKYITVTCMVKYNRVCEKLKFTLLINRFQCDTKIVFALNVTCFCFLIVISEIFFPVL